MPLIPGVYQSLNELSVKIIEYLQGPIYTEWDSEISECISLTYSAAWDGDVVRGEGSIWFFTWDDRRALLCIIFFFGLNVWSS